MKPKQLHVVVPGPINQRTGGYLYDSRIVDGLRCLEWSVVVHELSGIFPGPDREARDSLTRVLENLPAHSCVVIDGLAMGGLPEPLQLHRTRLTLVGLVHHPLADETGLDTARRLRLAELEQTALSFCRRVVVTSPTTALRLTDYGVSSERVSVVCPGTDPAPEAVGPDDTGNPQILCVATLVPRKGHDVLIRSLSTLREISWNCVCVGSLVRNPDYAQAVQQQTAAAGLTDRIRFVGESDSRVLDDFYHSSSMFVLPSYDEGYGMVLTEALVRGLPIVSTTAGAIPETVSQDAAILVPPGDDQLLGAALSSLLTDRAHCLRLAKAARKYGAALPDWSQAARQFDEVLSELFAT